MTIHFSFSIDRDGVAAGADWAQMDELAFRYDVMTGGVRLEVGGAALDACWGWVPVVDFAACHLEIVERLGAGGGVQTFEFTESDDTLVYELRDEGVSVSASWVEGKERIAVDEFRDEVRRFVTAVLDETLRRRPELATHPLLLSMRDRISGLA